MILNFDLNLVSYKTPFFKPFYFFAIPPALPTPPTLPSHSQKKGIIRPDLVLGVDSLLVSVNC